MSSETTPITTTEALSTTHVDIDAMSAEERFDYLNDMNGGYYAEQGLTAETLDDFLNPLEAEEIAASPEQATEAESLRAQVYELAAQGKNADRNKVVELTLAVFELIRRGGFKLAAGMALVLILAGCGPTGNNEPTPNETSQSEETEVPETPEIDPVAITAEFEIPTGLSDEQLAQTYVDRVNAYWNYGTEPELVDDPRLEGASIVEYGELIGSESSDTINDALYTPENTTNRENKSEIQANTITKYVQSLLRGETPYEHNLELVSFDQYGDTDDTHFLRITVRETSTDGEINNQYQIEVHFVVTGDTQKVSSDTIIN